MARGTLTCDTCGKNDDHPKLHYGSETYHHDCVPHRVMKDLTTDGYWSRSLDSAGLPQPVWVDGEDIPEKDLPENVQRALQIRKLAEGGTRGDDLVKKIKQLSEKDN